MKFILIPKHSDIILHNAKSLTLDVPDNMPYTKDFVDAMLDDNKTIEFEGIHYYVDEPIGE